MSPFYHHVQQLPLFVFSKVCTICSQEKSIEAFSVDKSKKDGYRAQCRECKRTQALARNQSVPPSPTKVCSRCHLEKPLDQFHKASDGKGGRVSACKECTYLAYSKTKDLTKRRPKMKRTETTQVCRRCQIEKPLDQF